MKYTRTSKTSRTAVRCHFYYSLITRSVILLLFSVVHLEAFLWRFFLHKQCLSGMQDTPLSSTQLDLKAFYSLSTDAQFLERLLRILVFFPNQDSSNSCFLFAFIYLLFAVFIFATLLTWKVLPFLALLKLRTNCFTHNPNSHVTTPFPGFWGHDCYFGNCCS